MADFIQEVAQHGGTVFGVIYFRVELYAIKAALHISNGGIRTHGSMRGQGKAGRNLGHIIVVAHPGYSLSRQSLEQGAGCIIIGGGFAKLASCIFLCGDNLAA